jgi:hypothetical protein
LFRFGGTRGAHELKATRRDMELETPRQSSLHVYSLICESGVSDFVEPEEWYHFFPHLANVWEASDAWLASLAPESLGCMVREVNAIDILSV